MTLEAVVFDFNGVLVDDEPLHLEAFRRTLHELGHDLSEHQYESRYLGLDDRGFFRAALADRNVAFDDAYVRELVERKARHYEDALGPKVPLIEGAAALVRSLTVPLAVASGARRREIELLLERAGLRRHFQVIVSADDVARGKPAPDPYAAAVRALALPPSSCVAIEDAPPGVRAAHAAGLRCVGFTSSVSREALAEADLVVDRLDELDVDRLATLVSP